jgi:uncharacterized protein
MFRARRPAFAPHRARTRDSNAMSLDAGIGELLLLAAAILAGGAVSGLLAGLFGVGGGGVIVPVLYEIFRLIGVSDEIRMQLCVGTSLAIIIPTSLRSFIAHRAQRTLPLHVLRIWALPVAGGVAAGGVIAWLAPAWVFKLTFVLMAGLIALKMLFGRESWRLADQLPGPRLMGFYGVIIGLYASVMGVGGGSVATLILMLYGESIQVAVALSAGVGVLISITGTVGYALAGLPHHALLPPFSLGFVSLLGVVVMAPISSLTAPYGARLAHALPKRRLEIGFGLYLLAICVRFVASLVW